MLRFFPFLFFALFAFSACNHIDVVEDEEEEGTESDVEQPSSNSEEEAFSVAEILTGTHTDEIVWAKGYIVGYASGTTLSSAVFGLPEAGANTNFLLANTPDETSTKAVVPVQLPQGTLRDLLNLYDHPELLGQQILIEAKVQKYFGVPGLKNMYAFELLEEESDDPQDDPADSGIVLPFDHEASVFEGR